MNKRITQIYQPSLIRSWPLFKVFLLMMLMFFTEQSIAQTLKTDSNVPVLDVCSDYQQFTVSIAKGNQSCNDGKLQLQIPAEFEVDL